MGEPSPQDDREARKQALEAIAERRKKQLNDERLQREARTADTKNLAARQQQNQLQQERLAAANLEARNAFIGKKREEKAQRERERLAKLAEEQRLEAERKLKEEQQEAREEYMGELHDKAVLKKIENRKEIIAHEEETSLRGIDDAEHRDLLLIDGEEQRKIEHLEREAKNASQRGAVDRDRAKAMAGEKKLQDLARLKQETFDAETAAKRKPEPARSTDIQNARREGTSKKLDIERAYKVACQQADGAFAQDELDRGMELQKQIAETRKEAENARKHLAQKAEERRNEAHVRRIGEEQWLLGKD